MNESGRISFPAIPGSQSTIPPSSPSFRPTSRNGRDGAVPPIPDNVKNSVDKFNASYQELTSIPFPPVNSEASVKGRLQVLEAVVEAQTEYNQTNNRTVADLNSNLHSAEDMILSLLKQTQDNFDAKVNQMKKEYDHRFELQATENKRLQNHVANLKADTSMLKHKLQSTIEKLRKLQHEFGDPDGDFDEESSVLFSSASISMSRPATSPAQQL